MTKAHYKEELSNLKGLAREFSLAHPAVAPMLAEASTDPDVERLLDGAAFQFATLRESLDHGFPQLVRNLVQIVFPQFLRPIPATTIVAFSPEASLTSSRTIKGGAQLASVPVDGTPCLFRTCCDVEIHPLEVTDALLEQAPGQASAILLSLAFKGASLANWSPRSLRLFLADDYPAAADLYLLLRSCLQRVVLVPEEGGEPVELPPNCLRPARFDDDEAMLAYPSHVFPGHRILQEFFTIPQRFLFLDLVGWERWTDRGCGARFSIRFELAPLPLPAPRVRRGSFVLFAALAVNLFAHDATPVSVDHRSERYLVRPHGLTPDRVSVYSIDRVTGYRHKSDRERTFFPVETFRVPSPRTPVYFPTQVSARPGETDLYVSITVGNEEALPEEETLSIGLSCTNGQLPDRLRIGDICDFAGAPIEVAKVKNITSVTPEVPVDVTAGTLGKFITHLLLNRNPIANAEALRELLNLYLIQDSQRRHTHFAANKKRIDSLEELVVVSAHVPVRGVRLRGQDILIRIRGDCFASKGDLFLFGAVLDDFLALRAPLNTFTRLTLHEITKGETTKWQPRLGQEILQ